MLVSVLAACGAEGVDADEFLSPDAGAEIVEDVVEAKCPAGVSTWRDVLSYWDDVRCDTIARCFPERFVAWFGDQAGCMKELGRLHCLSGVPENWCDFPYPHERCATLHACRAAAETLACDVDAIVPASCEDALR